jgi:hypothetical protein
MKLFSHPSHSPWKSLRRFPHYHRHDYDEHEYLSNPRNQDPSNDAQYHYPGGPNQMVKVGHAGIANSKTQGMARTTADRLVKKHRAMKNQPINGPFVVDVREVSEVELQVMARSVKSTCSRLTTHALVDLFIVKLRALLHAQLEEHAAPAPAAPPPNALLATA